MGLDMGVAERDYPNARVKTIGMNRLFKATDQAVYEGEYHKDEKIVEVIYFRNAYLVRNRLSSIIARTHLWGDFYSDGGRAVLTLRDVELFIKALEDIINERLDPEEYHLPTKKDVKNMKILYRFMKLNPTAVVEYEDAF